MDVSVFSVIFSWFCVVDWAHGWVPVKCFLSCHIVSYHIQKMAVEMVCVWSAVDDGCVWCITVRQPEWWCLETRLSYTLRYWPVEDEETPSVCRATLTQWSGFISSLSPFSVSHCSGLVAACLSVVLSALNLTVGSSSLSQKLPQYVFLGMCCTPLLQCLDQLGLLFFVGQ